MKTNLLLDFVCCCLGTPRQQHTISITTVVSIGTDMLITKNEKEKKRTTHLLLHFVCCWFGPPHPHQIISAIKTVRICSNTDKLVKE